MGPVNNAWMHYSQEKSPQLWLKKNKCGNIDADENPNTH